MKGFVYAMCVVCMVLTFLSAVCVVNGKMGALFPFFVFLASLLVLARVVDRYERG